MRSPLPATIAAAVLALSQLTAATPAHTWGPEGHWMVAEIAYQRLSQTARGRTRSILGSESFIEVATWADEIRVQDRWDHARPWHFLQVSAAKEAIDLERDCPDGDCAPAVIYGLSQQLVDSRRFRGLKAPESLKFLIHLVGDIHQPLHVADLEDLGGNRIEVLYQGRPSRLHQLWDTTLIRDQDDAWRKRVTSPRAFSEAEAAEWETLDLLAWASETHRLARRLAYTDASLAGESYFAESLALIERQLQKAGVRLAFLLEAVLVGGRMPTLASVSAPLATSLEPEPAVGQGEAVDEEDSGTRGESGSTPSETSALVIWGIGAALIVLAFGSLWLLSARWRPRSVSGDSTASQTGADTPTDSAAPLEEPDAPERRHMVFVSYSREDSRYVEQLVDWLVAHGLPREVFFVDTGAIYGGQDFPEVIARAIQGCSVLIYIVSEVSAQSRWVTREVTYALEQGKPVVPVFVVAVDMPAAIDLQLGRVHRLFLDEERSEECYRTVLESLVQMGVERDV